MGGMSTLDILGAVGAGITKARMISNELESNRQARDLRVIQARQAQQEMDHDKVKFDAWKADAEAKARGQKELDALDESMLMAPIDPAAPDAARRRLTLGELDDAQRLNYLSSRSAIMAKNRMISPEEYDTRVRQFGRDVKENAYGAIQAFASSGGDPAAAETAFSRFGVKIQPGSLGLARIEKGADGIPDIIATAKTSDGRDLHVSLNQLAINNGVGQAWMSYRKDSADIRKKSAEAADIGENAKDRRVKANAYAINKTSGNQSDELSYAQQRMNDSIIAARRQLDGMTQDDVLARTQSHTATGRENPNYDPSLARAVKLAQSRLYGDDPAHDAFTAGRQRQGGAQPKASTGAAKQTPLQAAQAALAADSSMSGYTLGEQTQKGFKVLDANGRHVGFYGRAR